jgi:hypothetical protein
MIRAGRLALLLLLTYWTWLFLAYPMREDVIGASFLHLPDLIFHEAGHILFSPFGTFMMTLGGSLTQVLVPIVCAVAFLRTNGDVFGAIVMGWWTGQNLLDVAIYINDARDLQLTLLGGGTGAEVEGHDWERLLTMMNALHLDHRLGHIVQVAGAILMIGCLIYGFTVVLNTAWRKTNNR